MLEILTLWVVRTYNMSPILYFTGGRSITALFTDFDSRHKDYYYYMQKIVEDGTPFVSLILTVITADFAIS
jgi:hypothetical protein